MKYEVICLKIGVCAYFIVIHHVLSCRPELKVSAWFTRPERPKGAKDEVKEARRAADQSRSWDPEGP